MVANVGDDRQTGAVYCYRLYVGSDVGMIAVYTALFGPYDNVQPAVYPNSFLFTDQDIKPDGWRVIKVESPHEDSRYASRYYFAQSCLALPAFEYTVMHGANAQLKVEPASLIKYLGDNDLACCAHPRQSVYDEAKAVIRMRKDNREIIEAQMERYAKDGFKGYGLSALILVVRRNSDRLREFETALWDEIQKGSHRDQLAFDYVRWKMNFPISRLPKHWNNYIRLSKHNHQGKK